MGWWGGDRLCQTRLIPRSPDGDNNNNDIYIIIVIDDDERLWQWLVNVNYINPLSAQGSPTVVDHDRCHLPRPFHNGNDEENVEENDE